MLFSNSRCSPKSFSRFSIASLLSSYSVIFKKPVDYFEALEYQHRLLQARQNDDIPDMVVLLQHKSVITIGNRGRKNYLLKNSKLNENNRINF